MRGEARYGRDVLRDDWADAAASQALTSLFSYGFATSLLEGREVRTLLDVGCGTGAYPQHLTARGFAGPIFGMDLAADAIAQGRAAGFESDRVVLIEGDVFDLERRSSRRGSRRWTWCRSCSSCTNSTTTRRCASWRPSLQRFPRARILLTELLDRPSDAAPPGRTGTGLCEVAVSSSLDRPPAERLNLIDALQLVHRTP